MLNVRIAHDNLLSNSNSLYTHPKKSSILLYFSLLNFGQDCSPQSFCPIPCSTYFSKINTHVWRDVICVMHWSKMISAGNDQACATPFIRYPRRPRQVWFATATYVGVTEQNLAGRRHRLKAVRSPVFASYITLHDASSRYGRGKVI